MNNAPIDIYIQVFFVKISFHFSRVSTEIWLAKSSGKCIFDFFPCKSPPTPWKASNVNQIHCYIWELGLKEVTQDQCSETKKKGKNTSQKLCQRKLFHNLFLADVRVNGVNQ